jgi:hypothetical protein
MHENHDRELHLTPAESLRELELLETADLADVAAIGKSQSIMIIAEVESEIIDLLDALWDVNRRQGGILRIRK